jgi:DNA-binding MarR family transcriptional regulator
MTRQSPSLQSTDLAALADELRVAVSKLVHRAREHSQSSDFTSAQKSVLFHLERDGPATVSALARAQGVKPQSMRMTVAGLQTLGVVKGKADPTDGRKTLVDLTPSFKRTREASRAAKEDWLIRALQGQLSAREQAVLATAVGMLQRLAEF